MSSVYITGDTHGDFKRIEKFCKKMGTTKDDAMIILGDSGVNYYTDLRRNRYVKEAAGLPITLFCIHGNHEQRAECIKSYVKDTFWNGEVLVEPDNPSIKFAIDGEVYTIPTQSGNKQAIVIGGAYSVDKFYRIRNGANWYANEQPSYQTKKLVEAKINQIGNKVDLILTHTCPYRYMPTEWFLDSIDQSKVDKSTELWLDDIADMFEYYEKWYCGHYHGDKQIDKLEFMFKNIKEL